MRMFDPNLITEYEAVPGSAILSFRGPHFFLSNMFRAQIRWRQYVYPATENAYFAWRTTNEKFRSDFQTMKPWDVKVFSDTPEYRTTRREEESPIVRVLVLGSFVRQKFFVHEHLGDKLLATDNLPLVEGNDWDDQLFGFDMKARQGVNALGLILMAVRRELRLKRGGAG